MVITQVQFGSIYAAEHEPIETLEDAIIYQHNQREWIGKDQQWQEVYDTQLIGYNAQKNHETSRASRDGHQRENEASARGAPREEKGAPGKRSHTRRQRQRWKSILLLYGQGTCRSGAAPRAPKAVCSVR
jgi:hypothetical protein